MKNQIASEALKKVWKENREAMLAVRTPESKQKQSQNIKQHYLNHPEHKTAISNAQKAKWQKIRRAITYCKKNNINLDSDLT